MPTTIKLKNSVTTTNAPSSLAQGEVAINVTDKKVWVGNAATTPIQIVGAGTTGTAAGSNTQVQYNSSGSFAGDADFTFNGTTVTMANDASISGLTVGKGGGAVSTNTAVGASALSGNTTGINNTAIGPNTLQLNSTGNQNTGVGFQTLYPATGSGNTGVGFQAGTSTTTGLVDAFGYRALYLNTTGSSNVGIGYESLRNNTTASNNTAVGYQAAYSNTTSTNNTAIGYQAGYSGTTSGNNTFVGLQAGYANTAFDNTFVGYQSGAVNTTGTNNAAIGLFSLLSNTTGSQNTGLGRDALRSNTTASNNTAVGYQAGYSNTTGAYNTFIGTSAGYASNYNGNAFNTCVGYNSGTSLTTGIKNTFIGGGGGGNASGAVVTTGSSNTIVGNYNGNNGGLDIRTASNYIVLSDGDGNPRGIFDNNGNLLVGTASSTGYRGSFLGTTSFGGISVAGYSAGSYYTMDINELSTGTQKTVRINRSGTEVGSIQTTASTTSYATSSDYRLKENIAPMTGALDKVAQLKPCTYTWKENGSAGQGFIAHELQAVIPDCVMGEKDAVNVDGSINPQGIDTSFLVATLTAAIQELNAKVEAQALEIATLKGN